MSKRNRIAYIRTTDGKLYKLETRHGSACLDMWTPNGWTFLDSWKKNIPEPYKTEEKHAEIALTRLIQMFQEAPTDVFIDKPKLFDAEVVTDAVASVAVHEAPDPNEIALDDEETAEEGTA